MPSENTHIPAQVRDLAARGEAALQAATATPPEAGATPPAPAPAPEPPPPSPAPAPAVDPAAQWEQRYRSLQGMFNQQADQNRRAIELLTQELADAKAQLSQLAAKPAPAPAPLVTAEDRSTFGEPLVDLAQRAAQDAVLPQVQKLVQEATAPLVQQAQVLAAQVQQNAQQVQKSDQELFFDRLDKARPDWEAINATPTWLAWLDGVDPLTGMQRQGLIDKAIAERDLARVVAFFETFAPSTAAPAPAPAPAPTAPPLSVAPSTVGSAVVPQSRETPVDVVTKSDIKTFYEDVSKGRYASRAAERAAMEARINNAVAAGRVIS